VEHPGRDLIRELAKSEVKTMSDAVFEEILAGRAAETAKLARAARDLIREVDPDVVEVPWPKQAS
jgi:hypothetical protein